MRCEVGSAKSASSSPPDEQVQIPKSAEAVDRDPSDGADHLAPDPPPTFGGVPLSEDDQSALEQFCAELSYPSISYEAFTQTHHRLDVVLRLHLTAAQCAAGGTRTVTFTRTVLGCDGTEAEPPPRPRQYQVSHDVSWPAGTSWNDVIRLKYLGDQRGGAQKGDLLLRVVPINSTSMG